MVDVNKNAKWTLRDLATLLKGTLSDNCDPDKEVRNFHIRPISCSAGSVFLPIGSAHEGMAFRAIKRGAIAVLTEKDSRISSNIPKVFVDDVYQASVKLARIRRAKFSGKLIGITGTAGKSTTKMMLAAVLRGVGKVQHSVSNQNLTPHNIATLASLHSDTDFAIHEMALHAPETVKETSLICQPDIAIFTSIGNHHSLFFEDGEAGILKAKAKIFHGLSKGGTAIVPSHLSGFEWLKLELQRNTNISKILTCGYSESDDIYCHEVVLKDFESNVSIKYGSQVVNYKIPVPGRHMIENSLLAAATLVSLGIDLENMKKLERFVAPFGILKRDTLSIPDGSFELISDVHNNSIVSIIAICTIIRNWKTDKRKILILGDVLELGQHSENEHRKLAENLNSYGFDLIVTVGQNFHAVADRIPAKSISCLEYREAIDVLQNEVSNGDLVFLKGSKSSGFDVLKAELLKAYRKKSIRQK